MKRIKNIWVIFVILILLLVIGGSGIYWWQFIFKKPPGTSEPSYWQKRFLYDAFNYMYSGDKPPQMDLRSVNFEGADEQQHPLLCEGEEVRPLGNISRSFDGKTLAFLLPSKEQRRENPLWQKELSEGKRPFTQGIIYLFSLENNQCQDLGLTADRLHSQTISFSPDGQSLAYVFYGLHVYNLETVEDKVYTAREESAHFPQLITGPLLWNQKGTAVYMSVTEFDPPQDLEKYPTYLAKVDITRAVDLKSLKISEDPNLGAVARDIPRFEQVRRNEQRVVDLPDFYREYYEKGFLSSGEVPDSPDVYAVSPEEKAVAFLRNGDLIIKDLLTKEERVAWKRSPGGELYTNRIGKIIWAPNGRLLFQTSQEAPGSGIGNIWGGLEGQNLEKLVHGENLSLDFSGSLFVYNFDYFGIFYSPPGAPLPVGFRRGIDDTGHQYNGLGVYDLDTRKDVKLSGQEKPVGFILTWFR